MSTELEVVGLYSDTNGRSCTCHAICGDHVAVGDVLRLVRTVVSYNGRDEAAIKGVKVVDGVDTCTVAYVPRATMNFPKVHGHINKFAQVTELYSQSKNTYKKTKSTANFGIACITLLVDDEGRDE